MTAVTKTLVLSVLIELLAAPFAFSDGSNLGVLGKQYTILEKELLEEIENKLLQKTEEINQVNKKLTEKSKAYAKRPRGYALPRASKLELMQLNPSLTLKSDIRDSSGNVLYAKGTTINPLDYRSLSKTLCFLDADDESQVRWLLESCKSKTKTKIIILNGAILKLAEKLGRMVYFDQGGYLRKKFGLTALPAKVYQSGRALYVEQIPLDQ